VPCIAYQPERAGLRLRASPSAIWSAVCPSPDSRAPLPRYARVELELALLCSLLTVRSRFRRPQALASNAAAAAAAAAAAIARASGARAPLAVRQLCPVQPQREHMIVHDGRQLVQILGRTLLC
jgi:hypothetical protein